MEKISKNFEMSEFGVTGTGLDNTIPQSVKPAIRAMVLNLLQPICDATGWHDKINSGYRSKEVNEKVGGVKTSQHRLGEAADNVFFKTNSVGNRVNIQPIAVLIKVKELRLEFDQMIAYPTFVHLSYTIDRRNRRQVLYSKDYKGVRL